MSAWSRALTMRDQFKKQYPDDEFVWTPVVTGVLLFFMQSAMAGWSWFASNWQLGAGVFFGFLLWILLVSLVAMASSAYVRWRIVAGTLVLGVFWVLT